MSFDTESNLIFRGEIKRALGAVMEPEACSECILFTMNESILNLIEKYDPIAIAERENEKKQSSMNSFLVNDLSQPRADQQLSSSEYLSAPDRGRDSRQVSFTPAARLSRYHRGASLSPTRGGDDEDERGKPHHLSRLGANVGGWEGNSERPMTGKKNKTTAASQAAPPSTSRQLPNDPIQDPFAKASKIVMRNKRLNDDDCPLSMSYDGIPDHMMSASRQSQWSHLGGLAGSASTSRLTPFVRPSTAAASRTHRALEVSTIEITLRSNWGDSDGIGLTGISALDDNFAAITLPSPSVVYTDRNGLVTEVENSSMSCSPDVLIDNENLTTDSNHMWYTVHAPERVVSIRFDMSDRAPTPLRGLNMWNYNGTNEEAFKGAKHVEICINGSKVIPAVLRKALGDENSSFEYAQFLHLTGPAKSNDLRRHNSTHVMETLQDSSPVRVLKNKISSEMRANSLSSDESSPNSGIVSISSPFDEASLLDGRFSPIQASGSRKKYLKMEQFETAKDESLLAPTEDFDFKPTNCMVAQQYETPVIGFVDVFPSA